jgi:hypothetical protein
VSSEAVPPWLIGMQRLRELERAAGIVAVLRESHRVGLLGRLVASQRAADLCVELGVSLLRSEAVLQLLESHGIVCVVDGVWA